MAACTPRRYTVEDVIAMLNANDSDADSPPDTDDEGDDNWETEESDSEDETDMADYEKQTHASTPGTSSDGSPTS
ncbi:hypothetical protein RRG08_016396 [Elysia crispata]|uniref:Uncharacterized protein n=1 Tax=Elysia crispata TaxID=231223 RepID=A0AAE1CUN2_9GAST|nr:hypothetical protein RRG08_016396 [Elysia crispata]